MDSKSEETQLVEDPVRILIVDDDDVYRELIRDVIEEKEAEVILAADGIDAVERLQTSPIDILITDLNMPRMDGLKLLAYARQIYPHILSIIITGYGSLESAIEAIRQGSYDYVQKPFKIERIALVIKNAIEKIKILRDRAKLLNELDAAYRRLHELQTDILSRRHENGVCEDRSSENVDHFPLYPRIPLHFYQVPEQSVTHVLTKLERLGELKREGVIDEKEFSLLKSAIINNPGSK